MSALLPSTTSLLVQWSRTSPKSPVVRQRSDDDTAMLLDVRAWLRTRPHTNYCRCQVCREAA